MKAPSNFLPLFTAFLALAAFSEAAESAVLFTDSFSRYSGVNTPPIGWTKFIDGGTDGSASSFWLSGGDTSEPSPDGGEFVRAFVSAVTTEDLGISITGFTVGEIYSVEFFSASGDGFGAVGETRWNVFLDGNVIGSSATTSPATGWIPNDIVFTATSATHTLGFDSFLVSGRSGNALLDGVSVVSVPEPSSYFLLVFAGLGLATRRRRKK